MGGITRAQGNSQSIGYGNIIDQARKSERWQILTDGCVDPAGPPVS